MKGTFDANVIKVKWTRWDDDKTGKSVPILNCTLQIGETQVNSSLFFDTDLITHGNDAGKSRAQVSLEVLESYGLNCDTSNPTNNDPKEFAPFITGKTVSVWCDEKDGKTRAFINRRTKPALSDDELDEIWAGMGGASVPKHTTDKGNAFQPQNDGKDDEDLIF